MSCYLIRKIEIQDNEGKWRLLTWNRNNFLQDNSWKKPEDEIRYGSALSNIFHNSCNDDIKGKQNGLPSDISKELLKKIQEENGIKDDSTEEKSKYEFSYFWMTLSDLETLFNQKLYAWENRLKEEINFKLNNNTKEKLDLILSYLKKDNPIPKIKEEDNEEDNKKYDDVLNELIGDELITLFILSNEINTIATLVKSETGNLYFDESKTRIIMYLI